MNIGIIYYSQTGNTRSVAERIKEQLTTRGHNVTLDEVLVEGAASPGPVPVTLTRAPSVESYDAVILGAPVQAFSLCKPMKAYLPRMGSLQGKKAACFVTKHIGNNWTGGNGAVRAMKKALESSGGEFAGFEIIHWSAPDRDTRIASSAARLAGLF